MGVRRVGSPATGYVYIGGDRSPQFGDVYRVAGEKFKDDERRWMLLATEENANGVYTRVTMLSLSEHQVISHWQNLMGFARVEE